MEDDISSTDVGITCTASATLSASFTNTPILPTATLTPVPSGPLTIDYTYDPLNRLIAADYSDGRNFAYTYDASGNVLELEQNLGPGTVTTVYTYDAANQLDTAQQGSTTWQYTYDANGSLISDGVKNYSYDSANRLIEVSDQLSVTSLSYNRLGQRLRMDAAGVIATYVLDGDRPLTATSNGNTTFYLYGLGAIGEKTTAWSYSLPDGTNTPRQLSNVSGDITLSARYTPWGDTLDTFGTGSFTFGYLGGVLDAATGLLYVGNGQYYDPATGRFLTRDANPNSPNPYVPWNPIGAILGPLGLVALVFGRRKKGSKAGTFLVLLLVLGSVGMTLAGCKVTVEVTPTQTPYPAQIVTVTTDTGYTATFVVPTPTSPSTPPTIPCLTPFENVPMPTGTPTPIREPWREDTRYNPNSKLIENWVGTRESRTQTVWDWICISGGWWGSGRCPTERELASWLLFHEGASLNDTNLTRMAQGIMYRFGRWGFNVTQLAGFTAFFNPVGGIGDTIFGELDWGALMTPPSSRYEQIIGVVYSRPVPPQGYIDSDGYYMYWFNKLDMDHAGVTVNMLPEGEMLSTSDESGVPFYFTGNNHIFFCATRGENCKP